MFSLVTKDWYFILLIIYYCIGLYLYNFRSLLICSKNNSNNNNYLNRYIILAGDLFIVIILLRLCHISIKFIILLMNLSSKIFNPILVPIYRYFIIYHIYSCFSILCCSQCLVHNQISL